MAQKVITIDCDGVLSATAESLLAYYDWTIKGEKISVEDITHHYFHRIPHFDLSKEEAVELWDTFFSYVSLESFTLEPWAQEGVQALKKQGYKLYVVTGRKDIPILKERTYQWFDHYFPATFEDIIFGNDFTHQYVSKWTLCTELGADVHIDDFVDYAKDTAAVGVKTLLLNKPWNSQEDVIAYDNIQRVHDWYEIYDVIMQNV